MNKFDVKWFDHKREPTVKPNPAWPNGVPLDATHEGEKGCIAPLPYPAKRCGVYRVRCSLCGATVAATTAGRADDPVSIKVPCAKTKQH